MKTTLIFLFSLIFISPFYNCQDTLIDHNKKLNVFIDCDYCDITFIKQELTYLSYVRDRLLADVHVQLVNQNSGSGGEFYTFFFYGQHQLIGNNDTLELAVDVNQTSDEIRRSQMKIIQLGLVPYMIKLGYAQKLSLNVSGFENNETTIEKDPWNYWVFSTNASGWFNGEELYNSFNSYGSFRANRITEQYKIESRVGFNYNLSQFKVDEQLIKSERKSQFGNLSVIKSISDHWSAGVFSNVQSSLYNNYKFSGSFQGGLEYNIFPYEESTQRQIRFQYRIGGVHNLYNDTTVYNKLNETLGSHEINIGAEFQQKWGTVAGSVSGSHYFHNIKLNAVNFWLYLDLRLFKGLSWNVSGNLAFIHNQISLPMEGSSSEDILLRQRQLQTGYRYWASTGITYTFGSIYNSVVNPRFGD